MCTVWQEDLKLKGTIVWHLNPENKYGSQQNVTLTIHCN